METKLISAIAEGYGLSALEFEAPVDAGYLSQNYVLSCGDQRFFLKKYRFSGELSPPPVRVAEIHRAKFYFAAQGLPVILPVKMLDGETIFEWNERCFALFPFVDGLKTRWGEMSLATLDSAGETLGRLHRAGHNVFDVAPLTDKSGFDAKPFWEKSARILDLIEQKDSLTEFDELAQESLRRKRELATQYPPIFHELGLANDHLVHGDFQNDNFFVDSAGRVTHIYDWELTKVTAREVALLRALLFMCLQKGDDFSIVLANDTVAQAERFLHAYHRTYPLDPKLLAAAIQSRQLSYIYSTWIEGEHYLHDNHRVDLFLPGGVALLNYFTNERASFTEWLCGLIE